MATLFELMGKIVVKNSEANAALKETQKETQGLAKTMEKTSSTTGKSMSEIAAESGKTVNQLRGDVARAAAEYQRQGMTASEAWKQAYSDIGYVAKTTMQNTEWYHEKSGSSMQKLRARVAELKGEKMATSAAWKQATAEMKAATSGAEVGMTGSFARIAKAAAGLLASGAVIGFGKSCVEAAATVKANNAQFEAAFGELQGSAKEMFAGISADTGVLATRLQTVGTGAFSQFKGAGLDAAEALKKTGEYTNLAADAAAYYDMSLEEADSLMRSFIRGKQYCRAA